MKMLDTVRKSAARMERNCNGPGCEPGGRKCRGEISTRRHGEERRKDEGGRRKAEQKTKAALRLLHIPPSTFRLPPFLTSVSPRLRGDLFFSSEEPQFSPEPINQLPIEIGHQGFERRAAVADRDHDRPCQQNPGGGEVLPGIQIPGVRVVERSPRERKQIIDVPAGTGAVVIHQQMEMKEREVNQERKNRPRGNHASTAAEIAAKSRLWQRR